MTTTEPRTADGPLGADYFERVYAASDDPWGFQSRWYEERKYQLALASLPRRRYRSGFEVGCSIGVLTALLGDRCDDLLAADVSPRALQIAATRVGPSVRLERRELPRDWPEGTFDLVVLSEVGYYQDPDGLRELVRRSVASLEQGGTLLAVHWRHPVEDYPLTGDQVHDVLRAACGVHPVAEHVEADFRLDVLLRADGEVDPGRLSVAASTGVPGGYRA